MKKQLSIVAFIIAALTALPVNAQSTETAASSYTFYSCQEVKDNHKKEMSNGIDSMLVTKDLRVKKDEKNKQAIIAAFTKIAAALQAENAIFAKKDSQWFFVVGTKDKKEAEEVIEEQRKEDEQTAQKSEDEDASEDSSDKE